jgi:endogenous inhibitor of DNA gyrase (YacG/DUF329 family)
MICPTCRKETRFEGNRYRPFCGDRCKLIDLGKWASDTFRVPAESVAVEEFEQLEGLSPDLASSGDFFPSSGDLPGDLPNDKH